ncbi:MAG: hypothetical protein AB1489_29150, partial [Acidobacteriota bacterium]
DLLLQKLHKLLTENLHSKNFNIATERSLTDAVLKISLIEKESKQVVGIKLVNRRGRILLQREFSDNGDLAGIANQIIEYMAEEKFPFSASATFIEKPSVPKLITPKPGEVIDNSCENRKDKIVWEFDWSDIPEATYYHLYVIGAGAQYPIINIDNLATSSFKQVKSSSYIIDTYRLGWRWKVRAKVNGDWTDWSEEQTFDVEPLNTDCDNEENIDND